MVASVLKMGLYVKGLISELTPRIRNILNIFEPMILPTAMSLLFLFTATRDVTNLGSEVPAATIVSPIIFSLI
jgi:hypothetical protein